MQELIKAAVEVLKYKVNTNLEEISRNEIRVKELLKTTESSEKQTELITIINANKNRLSENFDFINMQVTLLNFLEKYKNHSVLNSNDGNDELGAESNMEFVPEPEDYFDYTVAGKIQFNEQHPCFKDDEFFSKLITYYENREEYEKCAELMRVKNLQILKS